MRSGEGSEDLSGDRRDSNSSFGIVGVENVDSDFSEDEEGRHNSTPHTNKAKSKINDYSSPQMDTRRTMSDKKFERPILTILKGSFAPMRSGTPRGTTNSPLGVSPKLTPDRTPDSTPNTTPRSDGELQPTQLSPNPKDTKTTSGSITKVPLVARRKSNVKS
jgi:hypothetical protein